MELVIVGVAIAVIGVVAAAGLGRIHGGLDEPPPPGADTALPAGRLAAGDLAEIRFGVGLRGYRMDQVDAVLARVRADLRARDAELAELRAQLTGHQ